MNNSSNCLVRSVSRTSTSVRLAPTLLKKVWTKISRTSWGDDVLFGYVTDKPGRKQLNGGYKFQLKDARETTKEHFNNPAHTEIVVTDYYNYEMLMPDAWYLLKDAFATGA